MNLGTSTTEDEEPIEVRDDDEEIREIIGTPWFNQYIYDRYKIQLNPKQTPHIPRSVTLPAGIISEHAVLFGAPGGGKTTLALKIIHDQLKAGASAVVFDSKILTIQESIEVAKRVGLRDEQITIIYPDDKTRGIPGWNPLTCSPDRLKENASEFLDLVLNGEEPGVTIGPPIRFGAMIMSALGLSIQELVWFFRDARYREGLLAVAANSPHRALLVDALEYFTGEFKARTRDQPSDPVLNKIIKFTDNNDYIKAMFTANEDTLNLADLWFNQRLILVFLSMPEAENSLMSQMIARSLYRLSLRLRAWERPVVMMVDEIAKLQTSIKDLIIRTQQIGRAQGLWVLGATQDPSLLAPDLKQSLTGNLMALKVYFRMDQRDAASLARDVIPMESGAKVTRIVVDVDKRDQRNGTEMTKFDAPILYVEGKGTSYLAMHLSALNDINRCMDNTSRFNKMLSYLKAAHIGLYTLRIYQGNEEYFVDDYLELADDWELSEPNNVSVRIMFPKPRITERVTQSESERNQRAAAKLQQTPKRHAFIWTKEGSYGLAKLVDFDLQAAKSINVEGYLRGHQTAYAVTATAEMRDAARRIILDGRAAPDGTQVRDTPRPPKPTPTSPHPAAKAEPPQRFPGRPRPVKRKVFDDEGI